MKENKKKNLGKQEKKMQFKWVIMQNISIFEKEQEAIKYQNLIGSQKSKAMANPRNLGFLRKNVACSHNREFIASGH